MSKHWQEQEWEQVLGTSTSQSSPGGDGQECPCSPGKGFKASCRGQGVATWRPFPEGEEFAELGNCTSSSSESLESRSIFLTRCCCCLHPDPSYSCLSPGHQPVGPLGPPELLKPPLSLQPHPLSPASISPLYKICQHISALPKTSSQFYSSQKIK